MLTPTRNASQGAPVQGRRPGAWPARKPRSSSGRVSRERASADRVEAVVPVAYGSAPVHCSRQAPSANHPLGSPASSPVQHVRAHSARPSGRKPIDTDPCGRSCECASLGDRCGKGSSEHGPIGDSGIGPGRHEPAGRRKGR